MTQPGVYFALDAPFVRIICLFSNALEDPGRISSGNGHWQDVPDYQLEFLEAQLDKIWSISKYKGAVLLAVHHPFSFSYAPKLCAKSEGGSHGCSTDMLREIDKICAKVDVYPHAFLSGHARNYQAIHANRAGYVHSKDYDVPFIVCGDGGHHVNAIARASRGEPAQEPHFGTDVSYLDVKPAVQAKGLLLEKYNDHGYGYLRISVDKDQLGIGFHQVGQTSVVQSRFDKVTVDLDKHEMISTKAVEKTMRSRCDLERRRRAWRRQIYDLKKHVLAFDLRDLIDLLPRFIAGITASTVKSSELDREWFEARSAREANGSKRCTGRCPAFRPRIRETGERNLTSHLGPIRRRISLPVGGEMDHYPGC